MSSMSLVFTPLAASGPGSADGWTAAGETWTYAASDSPTFTFTVAGTDLTGKYSAGMRVRISQATGGTKYFIITKVVFSTDTTVTIYGGTDYTLNNEAISSPYYSVSKAPLGFPLDPTKWTVSLTDTSSQSQLSATIGTWYNLGSLSLDIPIGAWDVSYHIYCDISKASTLMSITLSTGNNSESDSQFTTKFYDAGNPGEAAQTVIARKTLVLTSKTTYYLNAQATTSTGTPNLSFLGNNVPTRVRAICAYL